MIASIFFARPTGASLRNFYGMSIKAVRLILKDVVVLHPEALNADQILDETIDIKDFSNFSNGIMVKIEAPEWVFNALKKRSEIDRERSRFID